ncbi:MAG: methylated-DNA--[protein]-cysteine S-methyltransferase [Ornithinimicrobium sp.]
MKHVATIPQTRAYHRMDSPLSTLSLVAEDGALIGIYFEEHRHAPPRSDFGVEVAEAELDQHPALASTRDQLREYFAGERTDFDLPLAPHGTDFQHRVWGALRDIPFGETASYGQIAAVIAAPKAARAVGLANGRNPISIVVPCHRVIGSNGALTGYGGGSAHKQALLDLEARASGASLW